MFGRIGDLVDSLNLDVRVMTASTDAFVAKEGWKMRHTSYDSSSDTSDDKDAKDVEDSKEEPEKENFFTRAFRLASEKVEAERAAEAKKREEREKIEAIKAEELEKMVDEIVKETIDGIVSEVPEEKKEEIRNIFLNSDELKNLFLKSVNVLEEAKSEKEADDAEEPKVEEKKVEEPEKVDPTAKVITGPNFSGVMTTGSDLKEITPEDLDKAIDESNNKMLKQDSRNNSKKK